VRALAVLATAGLLVAACGGDDDDDSSAGTEAPAATEAPDGTEAPAAETTAPPPTNPPPAEIGTGTGEGGTIRLWLNGEGDTPDELVEYAVAEFNKLHPDVKVVLERQQWTGIVERQTTALSGNEAPDVVEFGNTQVQAFEAAGALVDLTDKKAELGGDARTSSRNRASRSRRHSTRWWRPGSSSRRTTPTSRTSPASTCRPGTGTPR
jgi:ABC-type glycerol-3-phosphate transport system substrate-binding protein